MVNYGRDQKLMLKIANVDYEAEIVGIKIAQFPAILSASCIPLLFNFMSLAVVLLVSLIILCLWASRKETEGRPVTINAKLIKMLSFLPLFIRSGLVPSVAYVIAHQEKYRR